MLDEKARQVLAEAVIVRVTTIDKDGYPHSVPVWFMMDGEDALVFTGRTTRKVQNVLANPKGAIAIGGDPVGSPCYLLTGDFEIEDDPDHAIAARITHHYEKPDKAAEWLDSWKELDFVVMRLKIKQIISL